EQTKTNKKKKKKEQEEGEQEKKKKQEKTTRRRVLGRRKKDKKTADEEQASRIWGGGSRASAFSNMSALQYRTHRSQYQRKTYADDLLKSVIPAIQARGRQQTTKKNFEKQRAKGPEIAELEATVSSEQSDVQVTSSELGTTVLSSST
ncbi:unnamed protein product, partial [Symbiodinium necroappetens]